MLLKLVIMSLRGIANGDAVAISRKGIRFLFSPVAPTFIVFLHNCQYDTLAKYMTDCDIFLESYKS